MVRARNRALVAMIAGLPVVVSMTLTALTNGPAAAAPAPAAITHPQDDWAGSQIARHEGGFAVRDRSGPTPNGTAPAPKPTPKPAPKPSTPAGVDVSNHQGTVDWAGAATGGAAFAYIKATEGTSYVNPSFSKQYQGAYTAGLVRGAYHFATPNTSDGVTQANYFLSHGGSWSPDGKTLPPAVDLEYNPYGQQCYGMTPAALGTWVQAFVGRMKARTGRLPAIYTSTRWWTTCMGTNSGFGADPLWIARYNTVVGDLPPGWSAQAIWQYADSGALPGDQDTFNGSLAQLRALAHG